MKNQGLSLAKKYTDTVCSLLWKKVLLFQNGMLTI